MEGQLPKLGDSFSMPSNQDNDTQFVLGMLRESLDHQKQQYDDNIKAEWFRQANNSIDDIAKALESFKEKTAEDLTKINSTVAALRENLSVLEHKATTLTNCAQHQKEFNTSLDALKDLVNSLTIENKVMSTNMCNIGKLEERIKTIEDINVPKELISIKIDINASVSKVKEDLLKRIDDLKKEMDANVKDSSNTKTETRVNSKLLGYVISTIKVTGLGLVGWLLKIIYDTYKQ